MREIHIYLYPTNLSFQLMILWIGMWIHFWMISAAFLWEETAVLWKTYSRLSIIFLFFHFTSLYKMTQKLPYKWVVLTPRHGHIKLITLWERENFILSYLLRQFWFFLFVLVFEVQSYWILCESVEAIVEGLLDLIEITGRNLLLCSTNSVCVHSWKNGKWKHTHIHRYTVKLGYNELSGTTQKYSL